MAGAAPTAEEALAHLDVNAVRRLAVLVRSALAARRAEIDAMNVFPVPDGDTGTNLYLTVDGAIDRMLQDVPAQTAGEALAHFAKALLWTARGNSGVILSQLARGLAEACQEAETIDGPLLRVALARADQRAWEAVTEPQEGTILSVSTAMARGAAESVDESLYAVAAAALAEAQTALARTPEQLAVLARAGVVDAGGAGLVLVLECLERLCAGDDGRVVLGLRANDRRARFRPEPDHGVIHVTRPLDAEPAERSEEPGPEYEVMYLLADSTDEAAEGLRARLVELGDSVLVVGGDEVWNVHAHVDDAGAAIEAGIDAGRPHRIRVTRLATTEPGDLHPLAHPSSHPGPTGTGVVACAVGEGLARLFADSGAAVVASRPGHRASTGQLIDAIREVHATGVGGVVLLPNDGDTELAAAAAARAVADEGIEAHVVRARTAVQGIAAIAVYEPTAAPGANALGMQAAASATRHGAVTIANREALTSGGSCRPGDVLGVVDGDIVIVGADQSVVGAEVVRRLLSSGGELLTIVSGTDTPPGLVQAVSAAARTERRDIEVNRIHGGQPVYTVLLGVE
jgi:DAK2 domain fusion protein YloV